MSSKNYSLIIAEKLRFEHRYGQEPTTMQMCRAFHRELLNDMELGESIEIEIDGTYIAQMKVELAEDVPTFYLMP